MATQLLMEKMEDALIPVDADGIRALKDIPEKTIVRVSLAVPRNIRTHRWFFAVLKLTFENQDPIIFPTQEKLLDALKIAIGYVREVRDLQGKIHIVPDSISFGRMDETAFREFREAVIRVIIDKIIPGTGKKDFENQLYSLLREPSPADLER